MRRRHLGSVSAAPYGRCFRIVRIQPQLSVRGSWGTAPSVFWYGVPGGTQGPLGKGGAAERWRVAYPIGIATRHGAMPATTRTYKSRPRRVGMLTKPCKRPRRQATTNWLRRKREIKLSHSIYRQSLRHGCAVPPPFTQGRLSPPGDHKFTQ